MVHSSKSLQRVAVAGLGAIGIKIVEALDQGIDGLALAAVSAQNPEKHRGWLAGLTKPPAALPIEALAENLAETPAQIVGGGEEEKKA